MKSYVATIYGCNGCPNYRKLESVKKDVVISFCRTKERIIEDTGRIPDWCPLPEAKK